MSVQHDDEECDAGSHRGTRLGEPYERPRAHVRAARQPSVYWLAAEERDRKEEQARNKARAAVIGKHAAGDADRFGTIPGFERYHPLTINKVQNGDRRR